MISLGLDNGAVEKCTQTSISGYASVSKHCQMMSVDQSNVSTNI